MKFPKWQVGLAMVLGCLFAPHVAHCGEPPSVSDAFAVQVPDNSGRVNVTFDLYDPDDYEVRVYLFLCRTGEETPIMQCQSTDPQPGALMPTGGERIVVWDALSDYPDHDEDDLYIRVVADDGIVPDGFMRIPPLAVAMPVTYTMGSTYWPEETPHSVTLTRRFNMSETEVTVEQYVEALQWAYDNGYLTATTTSVVDAMDGSTVELVDLDGGNYVVDRQIVFSDGVFSVSVYWAQQNRPVVEVTWYGAAAYCDWLSLREGLPRAYDHATWQCNGRDPYGAEGYRLPTEAEWEIACRAGTTTRFNTGYCISAFDEANYNNLYDSITGCPFPETYLGQTVSVASYPPNGWGLFDMHGNVVEWCNDWYAVYTGNATDPVGPTSGDGRVLRGGRYTSSPEYVRSACRARHYPPELSGDVVGFRVVRTAE